MYSRPVPPVVVLTMDYERADSHGSYNIATCRADPMQEPQPRWLWRNAVTQCFNVLSEAFFYVSYSEMRYNQSIPPIWHRRSLTAGANFVRLWNRQIFLMHGCHTTTYDREFKVERSRIDTLGIDWNETTETNTKTFNGYDTRDNDRSDPYNTASRQVFVDDDFMIITTHRGYFVHSFHSSNSSGWLPKSAGGPQDLEEAHSAADPGETSSIQPPEALDLYERTDAIKLYATARARG